MTFGLWGELVKEVAFTFMFLLLFEQVHFVLFCGLLLVSFCEAVIFFGKAESIVISLFIYT